MYREFEEFVFNNYDMSLPGINLKYYHSRRVAVLSKKIAENLNLSFREVKIATQIGLLHDISRFYEYIMFNNFKNSNGFDHGKYGVKILNTHNYYEKFDIHKEDLENIYPAIYYHNKKDLPRKYKNNKFCMIIRDADKIDILNVVSDMLETSDSDTINPKLDKDFLSYRQSHWKYKTNPSNCLIFYLSFIYDLNYDYSCKILLDLGYLDKIYNNLKNKERYTKYFDFAKKYLEKRSKNVRY